MPDHLSVVLFGLLLGVRHALDPDHVVAVSTIVSAQPSVRRAARVGVMWGVGHTVTVFGVGLAIIGLRLAISPRVGLAMEFTVALMLVLLGMLNLLGRGVRTARAATVRPLVVGMVHGLAGSAAIALLVLATVGDPAWGAAYLLLFGLGTIGGMLGTTCALAGPSMFVLGRVARAERYLTRVAGAASLAFGLVLAVQIGVGDGLFSGAPRWTPH